MSTSPAARQTDVSSMSSRTLCNDDSRASIATTTTTLRPSPSTEDTRTVNTSTVGPAPEVKRNNAGQILPDIGLMWGISPRKSGPDSGSEAKAEGKQPPTPAVDWENYYSEEQKAKMRRKGINPALRAEMEYGRKQRGGREGGFWSKVAQTALGGGFVK